jgi:hypothetical protein
MTDPTKIRGYLPSIGAWNVAYKPLMAVSGHTESRK